MSELCVNRTLANPPPEVWPEFSEVERLANHLGQFGEISISRLEPEHRVAWEAEKASGTVELEASGEGTKVVIKAEVREAEPPAGVLPSPTVHQVIPDLEAWDRAAAELVHRAGYQTPAAQRAAERAAGRAEREGKRRRWRRGNRRDEPEAAQAAATPLPEPPPAPRFPAPAVDEQRALAVLESALENVGGAQQTSQRP